MYYEPFIKEFGPLNLSQIYRYVIHVDKVLKEKQFLNSTLYHYTSYSDNSLRTNAVLLICCYQILVLKRTAEQSWEPFANISPPLQPYKDVHNYPYDMSVSHLIQFWKYKTNKHFSNYYALLPEFKHSIYCLSVLMVEIENYCQKTIWNIWIWVDGKKFILIS